MGIFSSTISAKSPKFKSFYFFTIYNIAFQFEKIKNTKTIEKEKRADPKEGHSHTQKREFSESEQI